MTKLQRLLEDARAAGYEVEPDGHSGWLILKTIKVSRHRTKRVGIVIMASGWAFDVSVDPSVQKCVRSTDLMRKILDIKGGGE